MGKYSDEFWIGTVFIASLIASTIALLDASYHDPFTILWFIYLGLVVIILSIFLFLLGKQKISQNTLLKNLGVTYLYPNRAAIEDLIKNDYRNASNCRIFILRGMGDFAEKGHSLFLALSTEDKDCIAKKNSDGSSVRVLLSSLNSKFISTDRYDQINSKEKTNKKSEKTKEDIRTVIQRLDRIKEIIKNFEYKYYTDGFLCKFYLFDDIGYVIFNDRSTKIDEKSIVLKIKRIEERETMLPQKAFMGLHSALERYFDYIWAFQSIDNKEIKRKNKI